jgi:hypothetical protein
MQINVHDIAARVKLATFRCGKPGFARLNRKESEEIKQKHHLTPDKAADAKAIIAHCAHPALESLEKLHGEARAHHRSVTQPSITDGLRLVPCGVELDHARAMREYRERHERLAQQFLGDYPRLLAEAPAVLNGLYDERVWKPLEVTAQRFRFELEYLPCPTNGKWADWLQASVMAAQQELTERLEECIRRVAERCASDGPLYESVFGNLKEVLALVPHLNLADDPKIAAIAAQAKSLVKDRDRLAAKEGKSERKATAREAERIASMFGAFQFATAS